MQYKHLHLKVLLSCHCGTCSPKLWLLGLRSETKARPLFRSHLQGSRSCHLQMGLIGRSETSIRNYHYTLRNSPEERGSNLLRDRSLKYLTLSLFLQDIMTGGCSVGFCTSVNTFIRLFSHIYTVFPSDPDLFDVISPSQMRPSRSASLNVLISLRPSPW